MTESVTVLGTGMMGSGMAMSLLRNGFDVTVWNRSRDKAAALEDAGATVAADPVTAVAGADVVVTMLFDADAVAQVMEQALPSFRAGAVWAQASTVGIEAADRLARLAAEHGVGYLDVPVLGTRQPAQEGKLTVLGSGSQELRGKVAGVLEAIGARTLWVGDRPGDGQRLKLAANAWVLSITAATAQSVALAGHAGLDPRLFLEAVSGGPLDCAYAQLKGSSMIEGSFSPAFALGGAVKDAGLIVAAMRATGTDTRLMEAIEADFRTAADAGHADEDMAAVLASFGR
ncbi:MAG TPA: NAD(P)-dependent oxidoreductase [Actinocrinis sp.]|nr:NAD(P)-dependent oxidoreductase [Actinocrinis sp.]